MLSIFYTRKEIATRISILYTGNILATAFAGLIAAGVFSGMDDLAGLAGWRWLFILQGAVTFVVAVAAAFILPDDPLKTRWLTPEERELANRRIEADTVGAKHTTSTFKGLLDAAKDPKVRLLYFRFTDYILMVNSCGSLHLCNICTWPRMASRTFFRPL
jgi:MFS family permease